ncbi:hypothetical protein L6452_09236 [Arctium lappa]|uniref:Uncharacterized protein n=1 Tax=Arctium lappa TaxID=4217 RepID=A0ACB9DK19_ARCLA|nr:hypothetical protein L6452_09236 [Arctium lappa]
MAGASSPASASGSKATPLTSDQKRILELENQVQELLQRMTLKDESKKKAINEEIPKNEEPYDDDSYEASHPEFNRYRFHDDQPNSRGPTKGIIPTTTCRN